MTGDGDRDGRAAPGPPPDADRVVPAWAAPFIPDFHRIARVIDLAPGFMLVPVELPGPDVGRVLAAWLTASGRPTTVVEPMDDDAWSVVTAALLDQQPDPAVAVALLGTRRASRGMQAGLRVLNQRRDTVGKHLDRPLLWCGPKEFLDATWGAAPDFWSIADVTRRFEVAPAALPRRESLQVSDDASSETPERLEALYEEAKAQGDRRNAARIGTRLAEALGCETGELARAEATAREVIALVEGTGDLRTRSLGAPGPGTCARRDARGGRGRARAGDGGRDVADRGRWIRARRSRSGSSRTPTHTGPTGTGPSSCDGASSPRSKSSGCSRCAR